MATRGSENIYDRSVATRKHGGTMILGMNADIMCFNPYPTAFPYGNAVG